MASNNSRSSRRKPNITRKIVEDSNSSSEDKVATTQSDESDSNLPEGTVVVKPEAVEDSGTFSGPEFFQRKKRVSDPNAYLSIVTCTSCHKQINISKKGSAKRHPDLGVLICRRCHEYHISGPITKDEDGLDEQCRWCSEGGRLFGCDFCNNSFCRACIVHNLGRAEVMRVDEDEKWKCYICDGKPIAQLVEQCATILKKIDEARKQKKEQEKAKKSSKEKKEKPTEESMKKSSSTDELSKSSSSSVSSSGKDNKNGPQAETTKSISIKIPNSNSKYVVVTPSMASKSGTNRPSVFSSSVVNNPPGLSNVWPRKDNFNVSLNPTAGLEFERTQAIHGLPAFFALFKSSLTVSNVTAVTDRLLGMSGNLKNLTSSIRANITATDASQMSLLSQQSRKTAVDCIVNCMELFLQELQMAVCGVPVDFKNVRIVDKQKSDTGESVSKSNSVTIVLDSDNEDAYAESTSKEDKEMETNKDDKVASVKKETITDETRSVSENTSCASTDMETLPSVEDETVANLDKIKELAENMIEKKAKGQTSHNKTKNTELLTPSKRESKKKEEKKKGKDSIDDEESDSEEIATPTKNKILRKLDKGKSKAESKEQIVPNSKEKKEKEKETDEDSSDDEDSSSDEELATPKKRRSLRRLDKEKSKNSANDSKEKSAKKHKKQSSRTKQENKGSDSSGFDSDLEKEINSLSKEPKSKGKDKSVDKDESSKQSTTKSKESRKTKKKANDDNEDGSDSNVTENYDSSEAAEDAPVLDNQPEDDHMASGDEPMEASENTKAKEDLLNELDSSSSSELESMCGATKKESKTAKTSKSKDDESDGSDTKPARKSRPKDKLLDAKLSEDSDSDFVASRRGKKRKVADSRGEKSSDNNPEKNSDSDFEIGKKSKKKKKKNDSDDASSEEVSEDSDSSSDTKSKKKKGKSGKKGKGKATKKGSNGKKRRRIKQPSDSSDEKEESSAEDDDDENAGSGDENSPKKRKKIRKIKSDKKLKDSTKIAVKAEEERRQRVAEKQKLYNAVEVEDDPSSPTKCPKTTKLVLEIDNETKEPVIEVHKELVTKLKPHQVEAVQFLWDCTIESLKRLKKEKGAGCILAHCMGLGKTLSVISFLHTVMVNSDKTKIERVLVVSPLNTVLNWQYEFEMWVQSFDEEFFEVFELTSVKQNFQRADVLKHWHKHGGIMIIGYEMFRNLSQGHHCRNKKLKNTFRECLVDPGPDLVVCDEGHLLKNDASALSKAMNQIKTLRRVVLTGTPLQNNLMEYHCMVSFVKPNLLGTRKEFGNRFVNPIVNGQCADSTSHDVRLMKRRAHILHEKLAGCVQRRDYSALVKFLSPKYEYVLSVRLSPVQMTLYDKYLDISQTQNVMGKGAKLFSDYQALMRIWTHPWVLKMDEIRQEAKGKWIDEDSFIDDEEELSDIESVSSSSSSSSDNEVNNDDDDTENKEKASKSEVVKRWTTRSRNNDGESALGNGLDAFEIPNKPFSTEWWAEYVSEDDEYKMELSGKLVLLFEILKMCEEIGDKVLVFSQSLLSLDLIEKFLNRVDEVHQAETAEKDTAKKKKEKDGEENDKEAEDEPQFGKHWTKGEDYFRMDGSVGAERRKELANAFNDPDNYKARLFIISTKAGGLGINLVAANRVIIFDASWNPSHDVQSIFRVYRFGQTKPVYVYRFLAQGTMEEKIYERQVTKQSLSQRVVDEHQIERHFNSADLQELYTFKPDRLDDPNRTERPTPELPKDHLLAELLKSKKEWLVSYHVHDSLLENQIDQELTEEERKAAWKEYEDERQGISNQVRQTLVGNPMMNANMMMGGMGMMANPYAMMAGGALNQANLLQLVQDMKAKYPHLPEDQLTARVQTVIRQMITNQYMQQQQLQKQFERRELKHQQQLQAIQAQIQRQQQMQGYPSTSMGMAGPPIRHPYNGPEVNKK